jgi:hypothetical protein
MTWRKAIRGTRTVRVGLLDVSAAGAQVWWVAGPVDRDAGSRAGEVLDRMAALGPRFRVGLQPSPDTRRWKFTDKPSLNAKLNVDISGCTTVQEILDRVVDRAPAAPISVGQAGEYLCIGFDHGVGDANLAMEVVAALSHTEAPSGFVDPLPAPTLDTPVRRAVIHQFRSAPRLIIAHALSLVNAKRSASSAQARAAAGDDEPVVQGAQDAQGCRVVFVKSEPHFADELRTWREANGTRASVRALVTLSLYRALRDAGIRLADDCEVVVDLRRFLLDEEHTLSNFFGVAHVPAGADATDEKFGADLHARVRSTEPLVRLALHLAQERALAAVPGRRSQAWKLGAGDARSPVAHLTISDVSKAASAAKIRWTRPMDAELAVVGPPASASHLSISVCVAGNGSVQATAVFPASLVDAETVRIALQKALNSEHLRADRGAYGRSRPAEPSPHARHA